jgi:dihydroorotate dehydrogenase electron transfer subunit
MFKPHNDSPKNREWRADVFILDCIDNHPVANNIWLIKLRGALAKQQIEPGQFVHIRCSSTVFPLLRRPISISDVNPSQEEISLIYRVGGEGTRYLSSLQPGDRLDVLGPLGTGFPLDHRHEGEHVLVVGGGIGVPPLYYLSKCLRQRGVNVTHMFGFNRVDDIFLLKEFQQLGDTFITTADGSYGQKGVVTDLLTDSNQQFSAVYACGPLPMLKALERIFRLSTVEVYISLEQRMGCGVGACLACVCHTPHSGLSYKKVCTDGPVFQLGEVML